MVGGWLFLAAYMCSGLAGLVYEVTWTRLLTLYMGHTTAAVSTVLAAFMGGLAIGAAAGGRAASRLTRERALYVYAGLELCVIAGAIGLPFALQGLHPILQWAYRDGSPGLLFPAVRLVSCLALLATPAALLGATFPMAVRWFVTNPEHPGREAGLLYAVNTVGAATGAAAAGFLLIPAIGISGTTLVGVAGSAVGAAVALVLARKASPSETVEAELVSLDPVDNVRVDLERSRTVDSRSGNTEQRRRVSAPAGRRPRLRALRFGASAEARSPHDERRRKPPPLRKTQPARRERSDLQPRREYFGLAVVVVALTGLATFTYEVAWTRVLSMVMGPSTYAFAATLTAFITGIAAGSFAGSWVAGRTRQPGLFLAVALGAAAVAGSWAASVAGGSLPRRIMENLAAAADTSGALFLRHSIDGALVVVPLAVALGIAFPLALELAGGRNHPTARRLGTVYAVNTLAAVAGSLLAGFVAIPHAGLQNTIRATSGLLAAAAVLVAVRAIASRTVRVVSLLPVAAAMGLIAVTPAWDRELLASGMYKYAKNIARDLEPAPMLKAGMLLYYADGATGTVSVKRLTGKLSLAIDGKVDASTSGDMLTQKLLAHLPLLLHAHPSRVFIIGLGSGVTLASALVHPIETADVVEISPEVVEASRFFAAENRDALSDPRTRLIVGDGRSHLALASRHYDVIISEPSNPWMSGVAALFTREFFEAARSRLAPGGIICQWTHTYDITDADLRSIVSTFQSVFPNGTMWLVGSGDLLLIGSVDEQPQLENIWQAWQRPGVAADLEPLSLRTPFGILSLFVGGPEEMTRYGAGAAVQRDDRTALEFTGPFAVNSAAAAGNIETLQRLLDGRERPPAVMRAFASATAGAWRDRAAMMLGVQAYAMAYDAFVRALSLDPTNSDVHAGFLRAAVGARRQADVERLLRSQIAEPPPGVASRVALSKLQAATGAFDAAVATAEEAVRIRPLDPRALEQLASLHADAGDGAKLAPLAAALQANFGDRPAAKYYAAAARFLAGDLAAALQLARDAVAADAANPAAHNLLGAVHASMGQRQEARESFEAARRLNPSDPSTYTNLGLLALDTGDRGTAAGLFAEALMLDPRSPAAREGLARARR